MSKASERYKNSPKMERDEDSGKMAVKKSQKETSEVSSGTDGIQTNEGEAMPASARHGQERREMFNRHETEHSLHDGKDKAEMHKRHQDDIKALHKRHEKEGKGAESKKTKGSGGGKEKITKVENEKE